MYSSHCGGDARVSDMANRGGKFVNKLNPAWLQKVDVQAYRTRAISRISLFITKQSEYILSTYLFVLVCTQYVPVYTCIIWDITFACHNMD